MDGHDDSTQRDSHAGVAERRKPKRYRFEAGSTPAYSTISRCSSIAEQRIRNAQVAGSYPASGTHALVVQRIKTSPSEGENCAFESRRVYSFAPVAQRIRAPTEREVLDIHVGSVLYTLSWQSITIVLV